MKNQIEKLEINDAWQDKAIFELLKQVQDHKGETKIVEAKLVEVTNRLNSTTDCLKDTIDNCIKMEEEIESLKEARKFTNLSIMEIVEANHLMISTIQRLNEDVQALSKFVWSNVDMTARGQ